jgi:hypothetical protein
MVVLFIDKAEFGVVLRRVDSAVGSDFSEKYARYQNPEKHRPYRHKNIKYHITELLRNVVQLGKQQLGRTGRRAEKTKINPGETQYEYETLIEYLRFS